VTAASDDPAADRRGRAAEFKRFLEEEVWPHIPEHLRGKPITKEEQEEILGFGPDGV
jgi:antitoxin VapB